MKILIPVISFHYLTGAELYVYELARELMRRGHRVTVAAMQVDGEMAAPAKAAGIRAFRFEDVPRETFDLIHANEAIPTQWALEQWPGTPILCSVHSQYPCEAPVADGRIRHYICVRPEVQEKITRVDGVPAEKTSVIYNPIDFTRFHSGVPEPLHSRRVLFCGTIDPLRKKSIQDLIQRSVGEGFTLRMVGRKADEYDGYIEGLPPNVCWYDKTWDIENHVRWCDETAGILLGRTTIEGWACGKPGWIYAIDLAGNIKSRMLHEPPDMERFDNRHVVDQIEKVYVAVTEISQ